MRFMFSFATVVEGVMVMVPGNGAWLDIWVFGKVRGLVSRIFDSQMK